MAARRVYMAEDVAEAIFQDSGSEFGGDASNSDFEDVQVNSSDSEASLPSDDNSDSEPEHAVAPIPAVRRRRNHSRDRPAEQVVEWEVYEDIDPYQSEWLQDYNERQGILVDTSNFAPVDFFYWIHGGYM